MSSAWKNEEPHSFSLHTTVHKSSHYDCIYLNSFSYECIWLDVHFCWILFRRISTINRYLQNKGVDVDKLWNDIDDAIIKTVISAHSVLKHNYRTCFPNHVKGSACFEILGFDILLDRRLRPHVIEVGFTCAFWEVKRIKYWNNCVK